MLICETYDLNLTVLHICKALRKTTVSDHRPPLTNRNIPAISAWRFCFLAWGAWPSLVVHALTLTQRHGGCLFYLATATPPLDGSSVAPQLGVCGGRENGPLCCCHCLSQHHSLYQKGLAEQTQPWLITNSVLVHMIIRHSKKKKRGAQTMPAHKNKTNQGALRAFRRAAHQASQHINMYYICSSIRRGEIWPLG